MIIKKFVLEIIKKVAGAIPFPASQLFIPGFFSSFPLLIWPAAR
jgi:hypothetical protein